MADDKEIKRKAKEREDLKSGVMFLILLNNSGRYYDLANELDQLTIETFKPYENAHHDYLIQLWMINSPYEQMYMDTVRKQLIIAQDDENNDEDDGILIGNGFSYYCLGNRTDIALEALGLLEKLTEIVTSDG